MFETAVHPLLDDLGDLGIHRETTQSEEVDSRLLPQLGLAHGGASSALGSQPSGNREPDHQVIPPPIHDWRSSPCRLERALGSVKPTASSYPNWVPQDGQISSEGRSSAQAASFKPGQRQAGQAAARLIAIFTASA